MNPRHFFLGILGELAIFEVGHIDEDAHQFPKMATKVTGVK